MPARKKGLASSNLVEVARVAGVSVATVSRVLNGENKELWPGAAARAERIRKIASKLGYRPDWRARALRGGQTHSIGIVYSEVNPMMDMTSYGLMLRSFGEVVQKAGYHLMFVHVSPDKGNQPMAILQAVDAAVYYHHISEGQREASTLVRGPSILVNCEQTLPYPSVVPDDMAGARAIAQHLLSLNHRRIAFVEVCRPGTDYDHYSRAVRRNGFREALEEIGAGERFQVWEADFGGAPDIAQRYLSLPPEERPTALVSSYGLVAIVVLNELVRAGIRVPEELSIATFDDHDLIERAIVPMTTVKVPMAEMGRAAAELILGMLEEGDEAGKKAGKRGGNDTARDVMLPEQLIVRASTGPARVT